ncbi:ATP-binding protein [Bacteriovorax sp. PP10]|uniref:histidine kinase n=1 Tax=Bacteriovorax antarcticus TaxID=3088717 RepID=A0ABU5W225_9BACT|nr:ATP-binding protein [Bacteriovorax sp. PP10]MEA9357870.1 ATP-binding protein [Bacteriovorax sp. PP10]
MTKDKSYFDRFSITQEITIAVVAVIFLMISVLGVIVAKALIKNNEEKIAWQKKTNLQIATSLLADPIWTVDTNNIKNAASTFVKDDNQIIAVRVLDEYGDILVENRDSSMPTGNFKDLLKVKNRFLDTGAIRRNNEKIGTVEFIYSTQKFNDELSWLIIKLGISFLVVGLSFGALILWRMKKTITEPVNRIVETSKKIAEGNYQFQVPEENVIEFQLIAEASSAAVRAINERDLELKRQIAKAEQATKAKSNFVSTMSHEIRTPLNAIIGLTELTLDSDLSGEQRDNLETAKLSADSLLSIINDILDFSKIEAGKLELEMVDFDLIALLEECEKILALSAKKKNLNFRFHYRTEDNYFFRGDPHRLKQILLNIINNAIKFTSEQGEVNVHLSVIHRENGFALIRFEIQDTGIGIDKTKRDNLFEAFSQEDQSTTRKFGGTGLGLSISKKLIDLMGGTIGVESEVDVGSTFWFQLRLAIGDKKR